MPIVYQVIGKVAVCAVVCVFVITVMDSARSTSINEHGCNFSCAVIVRYIARDPARQLPDACVTREVRLHHARCTSSVDADRVQRTVAMPIMCIAECLRWALTPWGQSAPRVGATAIIFAPCRRQTKNSAPICNENLLSKTAKRTSMRYASAKLLSFSIGLHQQSFGG